MMDDRAIAGTDLDRLNPLVLGEVRRDLEVLVFDRTCRRHLVVSGIVKTASGVPMFQPSLYFGAGGMSAGLPFGAPLPPSAR